MDREDLKYIENGDLIDTEQQLESLDEAVDVKKFNLQLVSTDKPNVYVIIDTINDVTFEMNCSSDDEAIAKFEEFAKVLDDTNVQVTEVTTE